MTRKALGRGLRALIPEPETEEGLREQDPTGTKIKPGGGESEGARPVGGGSVVGDELLRQIPIDVIRPNARQPRSGWAAQALEELAQSIRSHGLLEPILLRRSADGFEIVAGERRWRACKILGWKEIPAIVRRCEDQQSLETALVENLQREDLNPVEEARAYHVLVAEYGLTHDDIARRVGKDRSTVTNLLRILGLAESLLGHVSRGTLSLGHARALLSVPEAQRERLASRIIREAWSVRTTEAWVKRFLESRSPHRRRDRRALPKPDALRRVEEALCQRFSAEVQVRSGRHGGSVEFKFHDDEDLSRLLDLFGVVIS
jgi:ParB family chromosome partitioning protein